MTRIEGEWRYFDDDLGRPFPWYTKPCLEWLQTIDLTSKNIFEYGVGDSTWWYRSKSAIVYGVDTDINWVEKASSSFSAGKIVATHDKTEYIHCPQITTQKYDIIVIDGQWRDECTEFALSKLKPGGFLIIDNYKQPSVEPDWPLTEKLIEGMNIQYFKEPAHEDWQTIVVTK